MLTKIFAGLGIAIAILTTYAGYTQQAALVLRQEEQINYWSRRGTILSGRYNRGTWSPYPSRSVYGGFRGGGSGAGK
jgi:hypothetical protein